jgi:hypothetical protein
MELPALIGAFPDDHVTAMIKMLAVPGFGYIGP